MGEERKMGFDANAYWREFEELSLKIVEIQFEDTIIFNTLESFRTQDTADMGIDGYLYCTLENRNVTITVEAKLRNRNPISLKDIATSIVNYLINLSDIHFVVTNTRFTKDALRVQEGVNTLGTYQLHYLDNLAIRSVIEKAPELHKLYPLLCQHILKYKPLPEVQNTVKNTTLRNEISRSDIVCLAASRHALASEIIRAIHVDEAPLVLVKGNRGVDKSRTIGLALQELSFARTVTQVDMNEVLTQKIFLLVVAKNILGLDLFSLLDMLRDDEKSALAELIDESATNASTPKAYIAALNQLVKASDKSGHVNYVIKVFLDTILQKFPKPRLLVLENLNCTTYETLQFIINLLPTLVQNNVRVICELSNAHNNNNPYLSAKQWEDIHAHLSTLRLQQYSAAIFSLFDLEKTEAVDFLRKQNLPNKRTEYIAAIISRFGCNPAILREAAMSVKKRHCATVYELQRINTLIDETELLNRLEQTLTAENKNTQEALCWCLIYTVYVNTIVGDEILAAFESNLKTHQLKPKLLATCLYVVQNGSVILATVRYKDSIRSFIERNTQVFACLVFTLKHLQYSGLKGLMLELTRLKLMQAVGDARFFEIADRTIATAKIEGQLQIQREATFLCRNYLLKIAAPEQNSQAKIVEYTFQFLELLAISHQLNTAESLEMLRELKAFCTNAEKNPCISKAQCAEYWVRLDIIEYKRLQGLFQYEQAIVYIDHALQYEDILDNSELFNQLYVYKALCVKNQGYRDRAMDVFRQGIRKYPKEGYIKACYLSNYTTYTFRNNVQKLEYYYGQGVAFCKQEHLQELESWLQGNHLKCHLLKREYGKEVIDKINDWRELAEKLNAFADISRAYNLEGVCRYLAGDLALAQRCFENSIQIFDESVVDQQKFLFRSNLLSTLIESQGHLEVELQKQKVQLLTILPSLKRHLHNVGSVQEENIYTALYIMYLAAEHAKSKEILSFLETSFPMLGKKSSTAPRPADRFLYRGKSYFILF